MLRNKLHQSHVNLTLAECLSKLNNILFIAFSRATTELLKHKICLFKQMEWLLALFSYLKISKASLYCTFEGQAYPRLRISCFPHIHYHKTMEWNILWCFSFVQGGDIYMKKIK